MTEPAITPSRRSVRLRIALAIALASSVGVSLWGWLGVQRSADAAFAVTATRQFDPQFADLFDSIDPEDVNSLLALGDWCRQRGYIREMLHCASSALAHDPDSFDARTFLYEEKHAGEWSPVAPPLTFNTRALFERRPDIDRSAKLVESTRSRIFSMSKTSTWFDFMTDLDKERTQQYSTLMSRFFDSSKRYFGSSRAKSHIPVRIYSKRRDYLDFYNRATGKNGENVLGFFAWNDQGGYLCFFDDPYETDEVHNTARHECTHLIIKQALQGGELGHFLNEGFACYLGANGEDREGMYPARCYRYVANMVHAGTITPLDDLLDIPYSSFDFRHYAYAWSWVSYLAEHKEHSKGIPKMFAELRRAADTEGADDWNLDRWEKETNRVFREIFGHPSSHQQAWETFVREGLEPKTSRQKYFYAKAALEPLHRAADESEEIEDRARSIEILHQAEQWLREAADSDDGTLADEIRGEQIAAMLVRAYLFEYDEREMTYVAAAANAALDQLVAGAEGAELASAASRAADSILRRFWSRYSNHPADSLDLLAKTRERRDSSHEEAAEVRRLAFEHDVLSNLIDISIAGCRKALTADPGHREATHRWLRTALLYAPAQLEAVFPYLLLLVELDPDDQNIAALAAAYAKMDRREYAAYLRDRALDLTPRKKDLAFYVAFVGIG